MIYGLHEPIDFIFDNQVMEKGKIMDAWDWFKNDMKADKDLIGSDPSFLDDITFLPLQAADLIAWWIRKMASEKSDNAQRIEFPWVAKRQIPGFQFNFDEARLKQEFDRATLAIR